MSQDRISHIDSIAGLSASDRSLLQSGADYVGAHLKLEPGANVGVGYQGRIYLATVSGESSKMSADRPPCPSAYCKSIQEHLDQYCAHNHLPPGTPVPQLYEGKICYCTCH